MNKLNKVALLLASAALVTAAGAQTIDNWRSGNGELAWQLGLGQGQEPQRVLGQEPQQVLVLVLVLVLVPQLVQELQLVLVPQQVLQALERSRHRSLWPRLQASSCCYASTGRQRRFSRPAHHYRSSSYQLFVRRQR